MILVSFYSVKNHIFKAQSDTNDRQERDGSGVTIMVADVNLIDSASIANLVLPAHQGKKRTWRSSFMPQRRLRFVVCV